MNQFIPDYTRLYIREQVEIALPGSYQWIRHYLYPSDYFFKNRDLRPVATYENLRKARALGPMEVRKNTLDGWINQNVILAQRKLRIFYQEKYFKRPKQEVDPIAHFYWFSEHLRRASRYHDQLIQLSL